MPARAGRRLGAALPAALAAGGAVGLLAVVTIASRGTHRLADTGGGGSLSVPSSAVLLTFVLLAVLGLAIMAISLRDGGHAPRPPRRSRSWGGLVFLALAILVSYLLADREQRDTVAQPPPLEISDAPGGEPTPTRAGPETWSWAAGLAVVAIAAVAAAAWSGRRRFQDFGRDPDDGAAGGDVPDPAPLPDLDQLPLLPPREAVIASAAVLEATLAAAGLPRRPSEAPAEYARRVRGRLGARGLPVVELTHLAELARFSHHDVDERMRSAALTALDQAMAAVPTVPA